MSNDESITSHGYEYYAATFPDAFTMLDENQGRLLARALELGAAEGWEPSVVTVQEFVDQVVENKPRRRVEDVHASVKAQSFLTRARKQ